MFIYTKMSTKIEKESLNSDGFVQKFVQNVTFILTMVKISITKLRVLVFFRYFSHEFLFNFNIAISI